MTAETYHLFLIQSFLPILATILAERFFIWRLQASPALQAKCNKIIWLEPNMISRMRCFMGVISVLLYHYADKPWGIYAFSFWMISDITDGSLARILKKHSDAGAVIDPLSDKLLYFPPLFYAALYGQFLSLELVVIYLGVDFFGQATRIFSKTRQANLFGKGKTLLTTFLLAVVFLQDTYFHTTLYDISNLLLICVIFLSFNSFVFRLIPNYWYANILSLLNLSCGLAGITLFFMGFSLFYTFLLVFVGQFLDIFDGRAAERWGSTPRGEVFDDLADGTSFGLSIGCIVYASFQNKLVGLLLAIFYAACTIYRLVRFLKDKKGKHTEGGTLVFNGLPSPAGALCVGAFLLFLSPKYFLGLGMSLEYVKASIVVATSLLMISHIPYYHFGRVILGRLPLFSKVLLYTFFVLMTLLTVHFQYLAPFLGMVCFFSLLYLIFAITYWGKALPFLPPSKNFHS